MIAFYDLTFNQRRPEAAMERCVGSVHIQHNPGAPDGKHCFIEHFTRMASECPGNWPADGEWAE